jgi:uncharacterized damage-inducible protein DinB
VPADPDVGAGPYRRVMDSRDTVTTPTELSRERADLLESLRAHRGFLLHTVRGLSDEQAARTPTVSSLSLGGLVKHVTLVERQWADFAVGGAQAMAGDEEEWEAAFRMAPGETLAGLVAAYQEVAARTDRLVAELDLDTTHPLPPAPWFEPGATRSVRRVFVHVVAEVAQHSGHADIIRETIDGQRTMG